MRKSAPLFCALLLSLSARRAWIEITYVIRLPRVQVSVALRKESVDRNLCGVSLNYRRCVALRKESVDRNRQNYECFKWIKKSLSARRAWIEILLLAAGVMLAASLSARRAWIEIVVGRSQSRWQPSLSARRAWIEILNVETLSALACCRSPQGERG